MKAARYATAKREAQEAALRIFCDTKVPKQDADKDKPDAFGVITYMLRQLLLQK